MHIVCPHCTTSFAIDPRAIGADGRTVRCARCKGTWFALPADAREEPALATAGAAAGAPGLPARPHQAALSPGDDGSAADIPTVESPPIAGDPAIEVPAVLDGTVRSAPVETVSGRPAGKPHLKRARKPATRRRRPARSGRAVAWPVACLASGLAVLSLMVWRVEVVRLLPQTAPLFRAIGLDVNLRGLAFRDVRTVREAVDGKPVLVVEGEVASVTGKAVELPRLRFVVRDGKGAELYAWTAGLERNSLPPGDTARFRSRLAEPRGRGAASKCVFLTLAIYSVFKRSMPPNISLGLDPRVDTGSVERRGARTRADEAAGGRSSWPGF